MKVKKLVGKWSLKSIIGKVCKNSSHNHIMARHTRLVVNHYQKGRTVKRYTTCR